MQQQLKGSNDSYDDSFRSRLSRVIVKLFARVVKAEESVEDPYVQGRIDMEALICSLEDILASNENSVPSEAKDDVTIEMIKSLLQSILSVHGSASPIRGLMEELGIDSITSSLGKLLMQCDAEAIANVEIVEEIVSTVAPPKMTPSKDVASLVSRLGCAPLGEEREAALASIRAYKLEYGDKELETHLQQLSGPFREFIAEQINRYPSPMKRPTTTMTSDSTSSNNESMSDRIRSLRSRLQASEMNSPQKAYEKVVETVHEVPMEQSSKVEEHEAEQSTTISNNPIPSKLSSYSNNNSNIAVASSPSKIPALNVPVSTTATNNNIHTTRTTSSVTPESKIPVPGPRPSRLQGHMSSAIPSFSASSSSAQSLRERLAARQGVPPPAAAIVIDHNDNISNNEDHLKSFISSSSMGRAAALRARLEVVKQQSNNNKQ